MGVFNDSAVVGAEVVVGQSINGRARIGPGELYGVITWDVDVLIPAALEDAIHEGDVDALKADIIVEGTNAPTTPAAHEALVERGVQVVPDILARGGPG